MKIDGHKVIKRSGDLVTHLLVKRCFYSCFYAGSLPEIMKWQRADENIFNQK